MIGDVVVRVEWTWWWLLLLPLGSFWSGFGLGLGRGVARSVFPSKRREDDDYPGIRSDD